MTALRSAECFDQDRFICPDCGKDLERVAIWVGDFVADYLCCHRYRLRCFFDMAEPEDKAEERAQNWGMIQDYLDLEISEAFNAEEVQP